MALSRLQTVLDFISYWKLQFSLATALYVLDPQEKVVVSIIMMSIVSLLGYTIYTYLPGHLIMMASVLQDFVTGSEHMPHPQAAYS